MSKPTILVVGDAVAATGFSRVLHSILTRLVPKYDFHHLGINYNGDPHDAAWKIYPARINGDVLGIRRLGPLVEHVRPQLIFLLNDLWILMRYARVLERYRDDVRSVIYFPVDSDPVEPSAVIPLLPVVDRWVTYTRFAAAEVKSAISGARRMLPGLPEPAVRIIPHGVDRHQFYPIEAGSRDSKLPRLRHTARKALFPNRPDLLDAFIVLNANRNQPRKRIDVTIEGFALFARDKPANVKLYLHMAREDVGWDVQLLARRFGVADRLLVTSASDRFPDASAKKLNLIYNACDVGLNTSYAEGWGLVSFEHAATGAAQIVPRHTTQMEIWEGAAAFVEPRFLLTNEKTLTNAYYVAPEDVATELQRLYEDPSHREALAESAQRNVLSSCYRWSEIAKQWDETFTTLLNERRRCHLVSSEVAPSGRRLDPPFVFLHIPKTGGIFLGEILRKNFSPEQFARFMTPPDTSADHEIRLKECIIGHFPYGIHTLLDSPCTYVAVLRNPYERVLSQYYYNLYETRDPYHQLARDHPLEEWLDLHPDACNLQTQMLSGRKGPPPDRATLKLAKENLRACGVVGLLEDFEGTLLLLRHYLGLEKFSMQKVNDNPFRPRLHEISEETLTKIHCLNAHDFELYRLAQEIFAEKLIAATNSVGLSSQISRDL